MEQFNMSEDGDEGAKSGNSGENSKESIGAEKSDKPEHERSWRDSEVAKDNDRMMERFNDWLEEHGYERATSLKEDNEKTSDRIALSEGTWNAEDKLKFKSNSEFSVLGGDSEKSYLESGKYKFETPKWMELSTYALSRDFIVTDTTGSNHNKGSLHYTGHAIDMSVKQNPSKTKEQFDRFVANARLVSGIRVRDERTHPPGQEVWTGPHVHLDDRPNDRASPSPRSDRETGTRVRELGSSHTTGTRIERFFETLIHRSR
jgi:hypothetical protein